MSARTAEQSRAIALLEGWGWGDVVAERGTHVIRLRRAPKWKWCAPSIIWYAGDTASRDAVACREHLHESWA